MKHLLIALCAAASASPVLSQEPASASSSASVASPASVAPPVSSGDRFVEANFGYSWYSPAAKDWGTITHRRVIVAAIKGEWLLETFGPLAIASTMQLVPLAVVQRTSADTVINCWPSGPGQHTCRLDRSDDMAFGVGGSPIGLKLYLNRAGKVRLFGAGAGGALVFSTDVPVRGSRKFNFTFEYGGGLEVVTQSGRALTFGYRFHHISNGSSAPINPGLDSNLLYFGIRRERPHK